MPLIPCPACGHSVSAAAPTCPQCGQPIAGVGTPPPAPARAPLSDLSIPASARPTSGWSSGLVIVVVSVGVGLAAAIVSMFDGTAERQQAEARHRESVAKALLEASRSTGVEYVTWQGDTLQVVMPRLPGDAQALADTVCNTLRSGGIKGPARVAILERSAYLNGRREYMGEARCSL